MRKKIMSLMVCLVLLVCGASVAQGKTTITVIGDAGQTQIPWERNKDIILERFDVELKVIGVPFGQVYEKEKIEFVTQSGAFDIVTVIPMFMGDFCGNGYLLCLDEYVKKLDCKLDDVTPGYGELYCKYGGKLYAVPYDGDVLNLYYRKDLVDNQEEKTAFKSKYGYELKCPETWSEYRDMAEFFTRKKGEKLAGKVLDRDFYGVATYGQRDWVYAWWGNRFASRGGVWFDEETMKPGINSKAGIDALKDMMEIIKYCPPDVLAYGYEELKNCFLNGDVAMVIQWPCVGKKAAKPEMSKIVGKCGVAPVPGIKKNGKIYQRAMMPFGRVLAIAKWSKHPWEAYQVIRYMSVEASMDFVSSGDTGLDPFRYSHFAHPENYEFFPSIEAAEIYLAGVQANMVVGYPELIIPGAPQFRSLAGLEITKALAGKKSAEDALNAAAKEWQKINEEFGLEKQKRMYQELVKGWRAAGLWD